MKKILLLFSVVLFASQWNTIATQNNLVAPSDADIMVVLRGSELLDKVSLNEMKNLPVMSVFFDEVAKMLDQNDSQIDELGINLDSKAQYFLKYQEDGSMLMGASFEVNDPAKYQEIFMSAEEINTELGVSYTNKDGYTRALMGNKGLITYSVLPRTSSSGFNSYEEEMYYYDDTEVVEIEAMPEEVYEEMPEEEMEYEIEEEEYIMPEIEAPDVEDVSEVPPPTPPPTNFENGTGDYPYENETEEYDYEAERQAEIDQKNEEIAIISKAYAMELLTNNPTPMKFSADQIDEQADFSVLVKNYGTMITSMMASPSYYRSAMDVQLEEWTAGMYKNLEWISMNGYYEKDQMRVKMNSKVSESLGDWYEKMLNKEFNSKMINYIPFDEQLTFMTGAYNTTEMLNGYYAYTKEIMDNLPEEMNSDFPVKEVASIAVDFVEMFMDEEAIGNLFKGDFYAGITNINAYDIEYTSYEYDDDWNYSEVIKTKEEVRPDFLVMFSSSDTKNINNIFKLVSLTSENEFSLQADGSYKLSASNSVPLDIYALQKDGIVFVFTSQRLFDFIKKGGAKPTAEQKNLVTSNSSVFRINTSRFASKIPLNELPSDAQKAIEFLEENAGDAELTSGKMKDNLIATELNFKVKGKHKNSLAYFLNVLDSMYKIDNETSTYRN